MIFESFDETIALSQYRDELAHLINDNMGVRVLNLYRNASLVYDKNNIK